MCGEQAVAVAVASGNHQPPLAPLGPLWPPGMWLISLEPHVASSGRCLCTTSWQRAAALLRSRRGSGTNLSLSLMKTPFILGL